MAATNAPKDPAQRRRRNIPERGEWTSTPGVGWQHGPIPRPPDGLLKVSRDAWQTWLRAWFAAHWTPDDLPALRQLARLYDQVERGEFQRSSELRLWLDTMGVSPKGQQDRRWVWPPLPVGDHERPGKSSSPYARLRLVNQ